MFLKIRDILFRFINKNLKVREFVVQRHCISFFDLNEVGDTGCRTSLYEIEKGKLRHVFSLNENYTQENWKELIILEIHMLAKKEAGKSPYILSFSESFLLAPDSTLNHSHHL